MSTISPECAAGKHSNCDLDALDESTDQITYCECHCHTGQLPILPYAGTSGWSGSDTSRERAEREDHDGTTGKRQREMLARLRAAGARGRTYKELCEETGLGHQKVTPALTGLHKVGRIARVKQRRLGCEIYVMPEWVGDRETAPYRPNKGPRTLAKNADAEARVWRAAGDLLRWYENAEEGNAAYNQIRDDLLRDLDAIVRGD